MCVTWLLWWDFFLCLIPHLMIHQVEPYEIDSFVEIIEYWQFYLIQLIYAAYLVWFTQCANNFLYYLFFLKLSFIGDGWINFTFGGGLVANLF